MSTKYPLVNKYLLNSKVVDKFLKVKDFTVINSEKIRNVDNTLYFDNYGNVEVTDKENKSVLRFVNKITGKQVEKLKSNLVLEENRDNDFILSENTLWILYYDNSEKKYYILYNFIHTPVVRNLYKDNNNKTIELFGDYCKTIQGADPTCSCLPVNKDICMERLFSNELREKEKTNNKLNYESIAGNCQYMDSQCKKYTSLDQSFIKDYYAKNPFPQNITINICSTNFTAGGDLSIPKASIDQNCSGDKQTDESTKPETNKPIDIPPIVIDNNKPINNKPNDNKPNDNKPINNKPTDANSNILLYGGLILIAILLLVSGIIFLKKKLISYN